MYGFISGNIKKGPNYIRHLGENGIYSLINLQTTKMRGNKKFLYFIAINHMLLYNITKFIKIIANSEKGVENSI